MPNPFAGSRTYARLANMFMIPLFSLFPVPRGFALLTVTGRRSGRRRQRPVRAVRHKDTLYAVAMMGERSDWLRNVRKEPRIGIKLGRWRHEGLVREVTDGPEREAALELYVQNVFPGTTATTLPTTGDGLPAGRSRRRTAAGPPRGSWWR